MDKKSVLILGSLTFFALMTMSLFFFKERTMIFDASYQLFTILEANDFVIQINRFGAACTQFFPLMASKLDWNITLVAQTYSISFILFYSICFYIILLVFKNWKMALVLLFYNVIMVSHSFFWIQCELIQGVAFTLVYLAYIDSELKKEHISAGFLLWSPFFIFTIVFFYPLLIFLISFGLLFFLIHYKTKSKILLSVAVSYAILFLIKIQFFKTTYDTKSMDGISNIGKLFPDYLNITSNQNFIKYLMYDYYLFLLLFLVGIVNYVWQKDFKKLGLLLFYVLGTLFIINVSFQEGAEQFYLEPQYTLLSVFVAFALAYDIFSKNNLKKLSPAFCALIVIIGLFQINKTSEIYKARLQWYRNYLTKTENYTNKKVIIDQKNVPMDTLKMAWASCYEFWLLSSVEGNSSRSLIISDNGGEFGFIGTERKKFLTEWGAFDYSALNPRYFLFKDTTSVYILR